MGCRSPPPCQPNMVAADFSGSSPGGYGQGNGYHLYGFVFTDSTFSARGFRMRRLHQKDGCGERHKDWISAISK